MQLLYALIRLFIQRKGHGFSVKDTKKSITPKDYVFGDGQLEIRLGGTPVVRPNGQWDEFLPEIEIQRFSWGDTFHCTVYGDENMVQTMMKAKYGEVDEYTERYLGVLAKIVNNFGGSPHIVFEQWRRNGNLLYKFLPFENVKNWNEFNSPKPMTNELLAEGQKWLGKWKLGHDWIWDLRAKTLMKALNYSPLGVGVYAGGGVVWQSSH